MSKTKYRCKICGYMGSKFIFELNDYTYCLASNSEKPEYLGKAPAWVENKGLGEVKIGEIVGCPKCHSWGNDNFEAV